MAGHNVSPEGDGLEQRARELKPCPWCGGQGVYCFNAHHGRTEKHWYLCRDCNTSPGDRPTEPEALIAWNTRASPAVEPVPHAAPNTIAAGQREAVAAGDQIEELAQFLHDEGGFGDSYPDRTWPEHPDDTGQREGGFVKIVPSDVQAKFRDVARRWLGSRLAIQSPDAVVDEREWCARIVEREADRLDAVASGMGSNVRKLLPAIRDGVRS